MTNQALTLAEYSAYQTAFDFFNAELFGGDLRQPIFAYQYRTKSHGYFFSDRFSIRREGSGVHEITLNPDHFIDRSDAEILSTLVHEMCHHWQEDYGKPSGNGYHNKEWARKMKEVGLQPSTTGEPGGKETGRPIFHYIIPNGVYAQAYAKLKASGFHLNLEGSKREKKPGKTKYTCRICGIAAWGKPELLLTCTLCDQIMTPAL